MASGTLLNAVTTDTTGTGVALTGDVEFSVTGQMGNGVCEIQRAIADVAADYSPVGIEGQFRGAGHCSVKNTGTNYYRAVLIGSTATAACTAKYNQ